jgi:hypothetical protein
VAEILERSWEIDSQGVIDTEFSPLEAKIDKRTAETIVYEQGRYQVSIPSKDKEPCLPVNRQMAASRLQTIVKALMKQPKVAMEYSCIIHDYETKVYVHKVTDVESSEGGWYLPHFPVVGLDKETTKVRIVMDAAAKVDNIIIIISML